MNVNTTELVPSLELSNNLNVMPAMPVMPMLPSYPIPMPMAMPSPYPLNGNFMPLHDKFMQIQNHHEFYVPPNPNSDQYMMEVENMEHLERVTKYRLEVMEGREDAVPPPLPRWNPNKPFIFVNSTLIERLEDLERGQRELDDRMTTLKLEKTHVKVIESTSINYCVLQLRICSDTYLQFQSIFCPSMTIIPS